MEETTNKLKPISQTLIKDLRDYNNGDKCGNLMEHSHIKGLEIPPTDVMNLGAYFEFIATGALPKSGIKPEPVRLKTEKRLWSSSEFKDYMENNIFPGRIKTPPVGVPTWTEFQGVKDNFTLAQLYMIHEEEVVIQGLDAQYQRAHRQAKRFNEIRKEMGIEILEVQEKRTTEDGLEGTRDLRVKFHKRPFKVGSTATIDLKYSGLLNNDYEPWGWGTLIKGRDNTKEWYYKEQLNNKRNQALQYQIIFEEPFYYWVWSSATGAEETGENRLFQMTVPDPFEFEQHKSLAAATRQEFEMIVNIEGFKPLPEFNKCEACPLKDECTDREWLPKPISVPIVTED